MITPSFSLTATERVLPKLALDFTTASLDPRVTFTRTTGVSNPATYVNSSGYVTSATNNQPRFDYNPITLVCKGLLIEESRANLCLYSEDISQSPWAFTRSSYSLDAAVSPANTTTADKLIENTAASNTHYVATTFAGTAGTTYTASIFLKAGERTQFRLRFTGTASFADVYFDLSAGTILATVAGSGTITSYGNGWYRCTITGASDLTGTCSFINYLCVGGTSIYTGNGSSGVYLWGAQLEAGAFATSYIPTTTTALTRNADLASMTGTNFSDWYNASEGTFLSSFNKVQNAYNYPFSVGDGTNNKFIQIASNAGGLTIIPAITDTTAQTSFSFTPVVGRNTAAIAYKENDIAACCNGNAVQTDILATIPTVNRMAIGKNVYFSIYLNSTVEEIYYFPQRLTNSEVQAITKWNT